MRDCLIRQKVENIQKKNRRSLLEERNKIKERDITDHQTLSGRRRRGRSSGHEY